MKLLLLADGHVGEKVTEFLLDQYREDVSLVVTVSDNVIAYAARASGVDWHVFESDEELSTHMGKFGLVPDIGVLAWWPKIIKFPLLQKPIQGFINFHPSLLPYCRGKHYNFWALVEHAPFGVSLHFVDQDVDSGDIVAQSEISYDWTDNGGTLYFQAQEKIVDLFRQFYPVLRSLNIPRWKQDLSLGSFHRASELEAASRLDLDKKYRARDLLNLLRARTFDGYPSCWFEDDGEKYEVRVSIRRVET